MNPKEKTKEMMHYYLKELLSAKYSINGFVINDLAKQCALIAVDEILLGYMSNPKISFWQSVYEEIEKLFNVVYHLLCVSNFCGRD